MQDTSVGQNESMLEVSLDLRLCRDVVRWIGHSLQSHYVVCAPATFLERVLGAHRTTERLTRKPSVEHTTQVEGQPTPALSRNRDLGILSPPGKRLPIRDANFVDANYLNEVLKDEPSSNILA